MSIRNKQFIFIYLIRPITFVPLNKCFSSKNVFVQASKLQLKVCFILFKIDCGSVRKNQKIKKVVSVQISLDLTVAYI